MLHRTTLHLRTQSRQEWRDFLVFNMDILTIICYLRKKFGPQQKSIVPDHIRYV